MILSSFVPGQETGNVRYVEENGVGVYRRDPAQIAAVAAAWLEPGSPELAGRRARARDLAQPCAALDIARALGDLLD
jgi:1,2-diacylglycerol 3-beta-galactosyltransferase